MESTTTSRTKKPAGDDLSPQMDAYTKGVTKEYYYWVGCLPNCPVSAIDLAGINWPKVNAEAVRDPNRKNLFVQRPHIGAIVKLSKEKIELIKHRLKHTVVRLNNPEKYSGPGVNQMMDEAEPSNLKGRVISIPTNADIETAQRYGRGIRQYVAQDGDYPASEFLFAQLCENQLRPRPDDVYPEPLSQTGLAWAEGK